MIALARDARAYLSAAALGVFRREAPAPASFCLEWLEDVLGAAIATYARLVDWVIAHADISDHI